jgi:hypothetical protein
MQLARRISKCCLLLLLGISAAVLWVYCHNFLPNEFTSRGAVRSTAERAAGIATLIVLFAAPALPIYKLFPGRAVIAAASIGWIPLLLSVALAYQVDLAIPRPFAISLTLVEGVSCWMAIVLGAWTVRSFASVNSERRP